MSRKWPPALKIGGDAYDTSPVNTRLVDVKVRDLVVLVALAGVIAFAVLSVLAARHRVEQTTRQARCAVLMVDCPRR